MVYYKLVLNDKRSKEDQVYPIVLRVTFNRISTTVSTGVRLHVNFWDRDKCLVKGTHPNWQLINQQLLEFYNKTQRVIIKLQDEKVFSFDSLKLNLNEQRPTAIQKPKMSFSDFASQTIKELHESNKSGNAIIYQTACNRLARFTCNDNIQFLDVDYNLLEAFKIKLLKDKVRINTISNYFRTIRAIYNKGIKAKLVDRSSYPFNDITIKSERTSKRAVHIAELGKIRTLPLTIESSVWHSRNYFILSLSLIGISFTDLAYLKPSNIVKGRLIYRRRKTHKEYNIKLTPTAQTIIDLYRGRNSKYLLPILPNTIVEDSLQAHKVIKQFIKTTNKYLRRMAEEAKIDDLTTYVARHSWATTAKRLGFSNELIAEALGHEYGNKITNIYLDSFDQSVIDDLNDKVLEKLI